MTETVFIHLPLERYKERYTKFLVDWEEELFAGSFKNYVAIKGFSEDVEGTISSGEVLDTIRRPQWALEQMCQLMEYLKALPQSVIPVVYFSDFFHPGIEALPYVRRPYRAYAYCWAQSFDIYDFTTGMLPWMRFYEYMAFCVLDVVFCAQQELADRIQGAMIGVGARVLPVGLPYSSRDIEARGLLKHGRPFKEREFDCVYSSRFDLEKNPGDFLDLVRANAHLHFVICTGRARLTGTDKHAVVEAELVGSLAKNSNLVIRENLSAEEYFEILGNSRVQFNCASQDWVSFTLLDALCAGCVPLYPCWRGFVELFSNYERYLYPFRNIEIASRKLNEFVKCAERPSDYEGMRREIQSTSDAALPEVVALIKSRLSGEGLAP